VQDSDSDEDTPPTKGSENQQESDKNQTATKIVDNVSNESKVSLSDKPKTKINGKEEIDFSFGAIGFLSYIASIWLWSDYWIILTITYLYLLFYSAVSFINYLIASLLCIYIHTYIGMLQMFILTLLFVITLSVVVFKGFAYSFIKEFMGTNHPFVFSLFSNGKSKLDEYWDKISQWRLIAIIKFLITWTNIKLNMILLGISDIFNALFGDSKIYRFAITSKNKLMQSHDKINGHLNSAKNTYSGITLFSKQFLKGSPMDFILGRKELDPSKLMPLFQSFMSGSNLSDKPSQKFRNHRRTDKIPVKDLQRLQQMMKTSSRLSGTSSKKTKTNLAELMKAGSGLSTDN